MHLVRRAFGIQEPQAARKEHRRRLFPLITRPVFSYKKKEKTSKRREKMGKGKPPQLRYEIQNPNTPTATRERVKELVIEKRMEEIHRKQTD